MCSVGLCVLWRLIRGVPWGRAAPLTRAWDWKQAGNPWVCEETWVRKVGPVGSLSLELNLSYELLGYAVTMCLNMCEPEDIPPCR